MKALRAGRKSHSISCSRLDWERIRERALEAGKPMSRYIVERALTATPGPEPGASRRLALDAQEQRRLLDAVLGMAELLSGAMAPQRDDRPGLSGAVRALFEAKMEEMARTGRYREMKALVDTVIRDERAVRIADEIYERSLGIGGPAGPPAGG